jgi:hypothetical protein
VTRYDASNPRHEATPTARFWDWQDAGWVKLSIRPGRTLRRCTGGPHEEGYSYTAEAWEHDGDGVHYRRTTWGVDCDGRHESHAEAYCPLADLAAVSSLDGADPYRPDWQHGESHQRDHTAEAAGY